MRLFFFIIIFQIFSFPVFADEKVEVIFPAFVVKNVTYKIPVKFSAASITISNISLNGKEKKLELVDEHTGTISYMAEREEILRIQIDGQVFEKSYKPVPLWYSIIPPLIAIFFALIFKEVISALFAGLFSGTFIIYSFQGFSFFQSFGKGFLGVVDHYLVLSLSDISHVQIIIFSMLIGGMVHIISANGGMGSLVNIIARYAKSRRSGQFVVWLLGVFIFFDDYANSLVVGNTMRPVTDRLKISREKLAYLVDSTAAPIASLALITTWIGIELSYIQEGIDAIGLQESAYSVFIKSLGTRFYPIFTLIFILILIWKKKDYGAMLKAEKDSMKQGIKTATSVVDHSKLKKTGLHNALIPILALIVGVFIGLLYSGWDAFVWQNKSMGIIQKAAKIIGNADSNLSLLWASVFAVFLSVCLSLSQRILSLRKSIESIIGGFKTMIFPMTILVFAWALAQMTKDLHTAEFISTALTEYQISVKLLPALTFIFSALIAFSTGSSWGTMAILYPLTLPVVWTLGQSQGIDNEILTSLFYNVVSSILAGSVLGDHISPISDTTVLSSLATSCNHIAHVRTQIPYALTVGIVSVLIGSLLSAYGVSLWIIYIAGILILYGVVVIFGKKTEENIQKV